MLATYTPFLFHLALESGQNEAVIYCSTQGRGQEQLPVSHSKYPERDLREHQDVVEQFVFMPKSWYAAEFKGSCWRDYQKNRASLFCG